MEKQMIILSLIATLSFSSTSVGQNLIVDQEPSLLGGIAARFNFNTIGYLSFHQKGLLNGVQTDIQKGYLGVFNGYATGDIDLGSVGNNTNLHLSTSAIPRVTISPTGDIFIPKFAGSTSRPVLALDDGQLLVEPGGLQLIHYAEFVPSDDESFSQGFIARDFANNGFIQTSGNGVDAGFLSAPIKVPLGAHIEALHVFYINESDQALKVGVKQEFRVGSDQPTGGANALIGFTLPKGGVYESSGFVTTSCISEFIDIPDILVDISKIYTLEIFCEDCSIQRIKAVEITYGFQ